MLDHRIRNGVPGRLGPSQSLHTSRLSSLHCEAKVIVSHWHNGTREKSKESERSQSLIKMTPESCWVMTFAKTRRGQFDKCTNAQLSDWDPNSCQRKETIAINREGHVTGSLSTFQNVDFLERSRWFGFILCQYAGPWVEKPWSNTALAAPHSDAKWCLC